MKSSSCVRSRIGWPKAIAVLALGVVLAALPAAGRSTGEQNDKAKDKKGSHRSAGFILSKDATSDDVGLPIYPGAQRLKDTSDESSAVQMGLWGASGGFRLVVLKLESDDAPDKVAAFYRNALAKYGEIVDCGRPAAKKPSGEKSNAPDCDDDEPVAGGFLLKAGTKDRQHLVGVQPKGTHSNIALVYVENPNSQSK